MTKKYRYTVGTGDSAKKDIDSDKIPMPEKQNSLLLFMSNFYKGKTNNEWQ